MCGVLFDVLYSCLAFSLFLVFSLFFLFCLFVFFFIFFFFFQAEDGIRDTSVTGVQTCALPISSGLRALSASPGRSDRRRSARGARGPGPRRRSQRAASRRASPLRAGGRCARSEERRVGKECRSRWSAEHE